MLTDAAVVVTAAGGVRDTTLETAGAVATGVVVTPGFSYGESGEGYIRISLTVPDDRLEEALDRHRNGEGAKYAIRPSAA